jgi:hypothetical protein
MLDYRLWMSFLIHDFGYWDKPNMDGVEGESHPYWGATMMWKMFGHPWGDFTKYHSRFLAAKESAQPSPLCFADKMAIVHMPWWLYLPLIHATGEVWEYMKDATKMIEKGGHPDSRKWLADVQPYCAKWVKDHKDGKVDYVTGRGVATETGVWK